MLATTGIPAARADTADGVAAFRNGSFAEAYREWHQAADAGDARAARFVGVMYDTGEGVPQDRSRAMEWYRRAAELGDRVGMFNVAVLYDGGTGTARDHAEAARWYARAARLHDGRAEYDLALMYRDGDGVVRDRAKARALFADAARDGVSAGASHAAGLVHTAARGPAVDPEDVAFVAAQRALLSRDPQQAASAATLFRRAAGGSGPGASMAQYDLAWCMENGIGAQPDREGAYHLYLQAAAHTDDPSLRELAETSASNLRTSMQGTVTNVAIR